MNLGSAEMLILLVISAILAINISTLQYSKIEVYIKGQTHFYFTNNCKMEIYISSLVITVSLQILASMASEVGVGRVTVK